MDPIPPCFSLFLDPRPQGTNCVSGGPILFKGTFQIFFTSLGRFLSIHIGNDVFSKGISGGRGKEGKLVWGTNDDSVKGGVFKERR